MPEENKLQKAHEAIESAELALKLAKQLIGGSSDEDISTFKRPEAPSYADRAADLDMGSSVGEARVIEGVFDGQNMVDRKGATYPVPANYASKSKLIPGDVLKLTVTVEGKFLYKQIGPVERKTVIGPLVFNDGQYEVLSPKKVYKVLLASVTYFRATVGDEVTLIIPMNDPDCDWGAIEAVLPNFNDLAEDKPKKAAKKKAKKDDLDVIDLDLQDELDI